MKNANKNKYIEIKNSQQVAPLLQKRRKELGITQKQLADLSNLSFNGISRMEVGDSEIKLSNLIKIGQLLGLKIKIEVED
ncbi:MAG: helix-turn-helix transcriptional regulator [Bdellovibrionales bacterium]|nr:helix-turn-helix transcriptional regulator [Bdellovibrionales bacterium]